LPEIEMSPTDIRGFRRALARWYSAHGRDLPWRRTRDPYAILVSELMLQQTQVATVIPYYNRWLERFPDLAALAAAPENDVLHAWQGLGYYQRARNLHSAAKLIHDRHGGIFPETASEIRELPGVGRYTANAVATFAFDQSVPIVEANITRVIARLFNIAEPVDTAKGRERIWNHAAELVPKRNAGALNSALMDLGATVCLPRNPRCDVCPTQSFCRATKPESLPYKKPRPQTKCLIETHSLIVRQNKILLEQASSRWRNMWILPPLQLVRLNRTSLRETPVHSAVFPFTNHKITLRVFRRTGHKIDNKRQRWFARSALESIPIPSPHRRAIAALLLAKPND
jgi:A/G-specific adenine glycosylase